MKRLKLKKIRNTLGITFLYRLSIYFKKGSLKVHLITGDDDPDYSNFYIIAPPHLFEGYQNPGRQFLNGISEANKVASENIDKFIDTLTPTFSDPVLVYELQNGYYGVIKSWGADGTLLRRVYGFFTKKTTINWTLVIANFLVLAGLGKFLWWACSTLWSKGVGVEGPGWEFLAVAIGTSGALIVLTAYLTDFIPTLMKHISSRSTEDLWKRVRVHD